MRISFWRKLVFSVGQLGNAGYDQLIATFLVFFLVDVVHLDPWLTSMAYLFSYGFLNAIISIVVGNLSDRTRTRWGRRKPWIAVGAPLGLVFSLLLWYPLLLGGKPLADPHSLSMFLYALIVILAFEIGRVMASVPYNALFPEMFMGVKERMEVSIYSEIFGVLGPVIVMVALPVMVDSLGERIGSMGAWAWSAGAMCVIFGVACFIGGVLGAKERKEFSKEFSIEKHLPFIKSLKVVLQSRLLLMYLVVSIMLTCQITWLPAMFPFLIKYSLGMSLSQMSVVMGIELLGTFAFYPLWRMVAMRIGSKKTFIISVTLFTMGLMLVLVINGMLQTAAAALVMGIGISGCMPVIRVMNADIIDEDELKTGLRREGVIYGVLGALGKISIAISAGATGFVLVTLSGYVPGATEQSPFVGTGIRIGMAIFGFIFWLLMMVALRFYPLSKEKVAEIEAKIKELHAEKAKRLEEGISRTETKLGEIRADAAIKLEGSPD